MSARACEACTCAGVGSGSIDRSARDPANAIAVSRDPVPSCARPSAVEPAAAAGAAFVPDGATAAEMAALKQVRAASARGGGGGAELGRLRRLRRRSGVGRGGRAGPAGSGLRLMAAQVASHGTRQVAAGCGGREWRQGGGE